MDGIREFGIGQRRKSRKDGKEIILTDCQGMHRNGARGSAVLPMLTTARLRAPDQDIIGMHRPAFTAALAPAEGEIIGVCIAREQEEQE